MDCVGNIVVPAFIITQLFGVVWAFKLHKWINDHYGGFKIGGKGSEGTHAMMMVAAMLILGSALTLYRALCGYARNVISFVYSGFSIIGLSMLIAGTYYAHECVNNTSKFDHFTSIHSQIGIVAAALTFLAYISAFKAVFSNTCCETWLFATMTAHFMLFAFLLMFLASMTGMMEWAILKSPYNFNNDKDTSIIQLNTTRHFSVIYCLIVMFLSERFECEHNCVDENSTDEYCC